jgi:hypothetical protein
MARDLGRGLVGSYNASDALQNEVRLTSIVGSGNLNAPSLSDRREISTSLDALLEFRLEKTQRATDTVVVKWRRDG